MSDPITLVLDPDGTEEQQAEVVEALRRLGVSTARARGDGWSAVCVTNARSVDLPSLESLSGVARMVRVDAPYRLASREVFGRSMPVAVDGAQLGGDAPLSLVGVPVPGMRGWASTDGLARAIAESGVGVVFAGEVAPAAAGSSVAALDGGRIGRIRAAAAAAGVAVCVEVSDASGIEAAGGVADLIQVGSRNMQNFALLRELGSVDRPVVLRRGYGSTIEEFLLAAEYVLASGNGRIILCESGSKPGSAHQPRFEINTIPLLKRATHLPVLADPARSISHPKLIAPVARAAVAAGADGLVVEIGDEDLRRSDESPLSPENCSQMLHDLRPIAAAVGRRVVQAPAPSSVATRVKEESDGSIVDELGSPVDVLRITDGTLATIIESVLGVAPHLEVVDQMRVHGPHPSWLTWLLHPGGDLLVRWTRYRIGDTVLTHNLAYVDLSRVDRKIVARLEAEKLNLGELFSQTDIDKFGFEFGSGAEAGEVDTALRRGHGEKVGRHPYVWRRYIAATSGRIGFLVIEALPNSTWRRLLRSEEERARLKEGA